MGQTDQIAEISNVGGLIDAALQIAASRRQKMDRLRTALINSNDGEALRFARELCGLENDNVSDRTEQVDLQKGHECPAA